MKILFCNSSPDRTSDIQKFFSEDEIVFFSGLASEALEGLDAEVLTVFVESKLPKTVLDRFPNLKFIATRSTGYDHIDLDACRERGIQVASVPAYGERTVAEYAFALLLCLSRKIFEGVYRVKHQNTFSNEGLTGFDLYEKTIGIIGTGKIGCHVAMIAQSFGMHILASDIKENSELVSKCRVAYVPLEELLQKSDCITLHAPYLPSTHHMLNRTNLSLVKPGSVLVNTARGALVDTVALLEVLKGGQLAGAALDVLEEEGYIGDELELVHGHPKKEQLDAVLADHELLSLPNVLVTPHNAFNSVEALDRIWQTTYENIQGYKAGQLINLVK